MQIFIISLPGAEARRAFQRKQAQRLGLEIEFVEAVDARALDAASCQRAADHWTRPIARKDIACHLSHRLAWQRVVAAGRPCLVLEDDAVLSDRMPAVLATIDAREDAWNTIYDLEFVPRPHIIARRPFWRSTDGGFAAARIYENRNGLGAAVIAPGAARRLLAETGEFVLVDAFLWNRRWACHYQIEPAPAMQMEYFYPDRTQVARSNPGATDEHFAPRSVLRAQAHALRNELRKLPRILRGLAFGRLRMIAVERGDFPAS